MKTIVALLLLSSSLVATAGQVSGYTRSDGTYVAPHYRAEPDQHRYNNPSSQSLGGNQRDEYSAKPRYNLSSPQYNPYLDSNRNGTPDYAE